MVTSSVPLVASAPSSVPPSSVPSASAPILTQGEGGNSIVQSVPQTVSSTVVPAPIIITDFSEFQAWLAPSIGFILFAIACVFGALIGKALNWFKW